MTVATRQFFAEALAAYERAAERAGEIQRCFTIAGHAVSIECAGPALVQPLTEALSNPAPCDGASPKLRVRAFDSATTASPMPEPAWAEHAYTGRGDVIGFTDDRFMTSYRLGGRDLSVVDRRTGEAIFWVPEAEKLSEYERSAPLRTIFSAWFGTGTGVLVHAGAVGSSAGGVLIVGEGGRGKSTLAVASAMAGMAYAGDDYVLAVRRPDSRVHSLYRTAKLAVDHLRSTFPDLYSVIRGASPTRDGKTVFFPDAAGMSVTAGFPLRAIVVPRRGRSRTELLPARAGEMLKAMLPSTVRQLAGTGRHTFAALSELCRSVPGFVLELGNDGLQAGPQLLQELSAS